MPSRPGETNVGKLISELAKGEGVGKEASELAKTKPGAVADLVKFVKQYS